jgi:hypothetical protein
LLYLQGEEKDMEEKIKNLCAPIPEALHAKVREQQEASGQNLGQYMTWLITTFYDYENGGKKTMASIIIIMYR